MTSKPAKDASADPCNNCGAFNAYNSDYLVEDESHQVVSSLFMGPKAENFEWFKQTLIEILEAQREARLDYYPRDGKVITDWIKSSAPFRKSTRKMTNAMRTASNLLAKHSIPFWSPRYQGHMCMDLAMPALLGYFMTMLYNPNNVSIEASPLSTVAELQVGEDLCKMFGYNTDRDKKDSKTGELQPIGWGHITCDGTIANLESMWVARNLKFYPLSIMSAMQEGGPLHFIRDEFYIYTCQGKRELLKTFEDDVWPVLNLRPKEVLDIPERLYREFYISPGFLNSVMQDYGIQTKGKRALEEQWKVKNMKYYLSNTRHYSWPKSGAIVGIGSEHIVGIEVDIEARVDIKDLKKKLDDCVRDQIPVYAVVAIMGTTEEGAVDPLAEILTLRQEYQDNHGLSFLVHGDGAWGGYFCTMLPEKFVPGQGFDHWQPVNGDTPIGGTQGYVPDASLKPQSAEGLFALRYADSVTVDPHKSAYVPYPAGGLCYRDGRMRYLVTWTSPYISRGEIVETSIGVFGVEGSKPGASVMSTFMANKCIGLNETGYGKLLGEVTFTCNRLAAEWAAMSRPEDSFVIRPVNLTPAEFDKKSEKEIEEEREIIRERILKKTNLQILQEDAELKPGERKTMHLLSQLGSDLNINAFGANWKYEDNTVNDDVEEANYFNQLVISKLSVDSPEDDPTKIPFFLTSTTFMHHEYGPCVQALKERLGLLQDHNDLVVMRNVVMSPWPTDGYFIGNLVKEYRKALEEAVEVCRERNDGKPIKRKFLLQGTDKNRIYAVNFPMFNVEKFRRQLIFQVELPQDAVDVYLKAKKDDPEGVFVLTTMDSEYTLDDLVVPNASFTGAICKKVFVNPLMWPMPEEYPALVKDVPVTIPKVVKYRNLKAQYRDRDYPRDFVPFYLYGTKTSLNIDHVLVKSPNISLSADSITLEDSLLNKLDDGKLAAGYILAIDDHSEIAMQPFPSNEGPLGDTLNSDSNFFFTPGKTWHCRVYEDPRGPTENGPGLVNIPGAPSSAPELINIGVGKGKSGKEPEFKLVGDGKITLNARRYVDTVNVNKDPFHIPEGTEKYKKWKAQFDSIGKELDD